MAQRFAIDGNFTQSFVGTVSLNAEACPSNVDNFATLFYDLDNGAVCYVTASSDFCYEFFFDSENTIPLSKVQTNDAEQASPPEQSFQFVGTPTGGPIGSTSQPRTSLDDTFYIMFDSSSANAGDLKNYLIQNTESGSLKLSTTTEAVQINYTAQTVTGSNANKIILGNSNNIPTASNPQFTVLTTTSDEPFTQGERVCVEILTSGGGGTSTTFQTGSSLVQTQLSNLKIIDFDSNVFVTSDPVTGELTLQFGSPALPTLNSPSIPTTTSQGTTNFNTNRFSGPDLEGTAHDSPFVIDQNYRIQLTYATASSNTFKSASVLADVDGVETEILSTTTYGEGVAQTFNISNASAANLNYFHSGSHSFKGKVTVVLEDGTLFTTSSAASLAAIAKGNPDNPTYNITYDLLGGSAFISNTGNNDTNISVELGATGSAVFSGAYGSSDNGWTQVSISPDSSSPTTLTITQTSTTNFSDVTANYTSSNKGTNASGNSTAQVTADKNVSRIASLRYGALAASTFSDNLSPTESELLDVLNWTNSGGTIDFGTNTSSEINGEAFSVSWTGDKFIYIVMDNNVTLDKIDIGVLNQIGAFTTGTTTNYRFYVTTDIQAQAASPFNITLSTT